jgi:hypothetical protein
MLLTDRWVTQRGGTVLKKHNLKVIEKEGMEAVREVIEVHRLEKIASPYGCKLGSIADSLLRDDQDTNNRISLLFSDSLPRLAMVNRVLEHAGEAGGKLQYDEFTGLELAFKEIYALIAAAVDLDTRRM